MNSLIWQSVMWRPGKGEVPHSMKNFPRIRPAATASQPAPFGGTLIAGFATSVGLRQARRHGIALRQSHTRLAKAAMVRAGRHAHARQFRRMRRALRQLRTYLGRVYCDVARKIAGNPVLEGRFARLLGLVERLMAQKPKDKHRRIKLCMRPRWFASPRARPAPPTSSAPRSASL
jgi:hypothetical protein